MSSCSTLLKGYIRLDPQKDELLATQQIKDFMKINNNPSIVLRVPSSEAQSKQADLNDYVYNGIEKELTLAGFKVKDRELSNEAMDKSSGKDQQNKKLIGIDLILEVVRIENNKKYSTNTVYRKNGKEKILHDYYSIAKFGALVELKIVIVKNNEYGGSFSFNYTPCPPENTNCNCIVAFKDVPDRVYPTISFCNKKSYTVFDNVDKSTVEELARNGVKKMMEEIRK